MFEQLDPDINFLYIAIHNEYFAIYVQYATVPSIQFGGVIKII